MHLNRFLYSKALASIRSDNYAHPGEEENIDLLIKRIPRDKNKKILDFGCGLGGTLDYIRSQGFSSLHGIDIDKKSIAFANSKYPKISFYDSMDKVGNNYDLIFSINVFYLIENKKEILNCLYSISNSEALLIISDFTTKNKLSNSDKLKSFIPFSLENNMELNNWNVSHEEDISEQYIKWYEDFVAKIHSKREIVIEVANETYYQYILNKYQYILQTLKFGELGGKILCLRK